jgi:predicted Zn finger-like uncharacterized protein
MNFICEKCKQKYHVADEKLQGRAVTRFRCKKCDHIIELEAPTQTALSGASATGSSPPHAPRPATMAVPAVRSVGPAKPRPATTSGPAFGSSGFGAAPARAATMATPAARSAASAQLSNRPAGSSDRGWYAGIRDVPVGPLSRVELAARVQAGDIVPETLVWREGLDDWRPLQNIAELADLLRPPAAASGPSESARQSTATRSSRPSVLDDDEEATRVSGLDPSLAGIMGKASRAKISEKPEAERSKPPGSSLSPLARTPNPRPATATSPDKVDATPAPARPPEAPASAGVATPVVNVAALAHASGDALAAKPSHGHDAPAEKRPEDELLDELFAKPTRSASTPSQRPPMESSPLLTPPAQPVATVPPGALSTPPVGPPSPPAPTTPVPSLDALVSTPPATTSATPALAPLLGPTPDLMAPPVVPLPAPTPPPPTAPRSLPAAVWLMMVGVLVAGLLGGLYLGRMNAPRPEATPTPPPRPPVPTPQLAVPDGSVDVAIAAPRGEAPAGEAVQQTALALAPSSPRADALVRAFQDSHVVQTCWQSTLALRPELQATAVTIDLRADARGRLASLDVGQSPDPRFDACLRGRLDAVASIGEGDTVDARTSVSLAVHP